MRVHFIAIGGSAMHNLAIALKKKGVYVTGSDDQIFEPSFSRLAQHDLLPEKMGWDPGLIVDEIDIVILGMHARHDNEELMEAKRKGLKICSYPEFLYQQTKGKTRVVISGSHGKTTITSMVMHVLRRCSIGFDYMVGAQLDGFDTMVELNDKNRIAIFEGDEYLSSPIDRRPKFHWYDPHIALISGIEWDHINVFETYDDYVNQFKIFAGLIRDSGSLILYAADDNLKEIGERVKNRLNVSTYREHPYKVKDGITFLKRGKDSVRLDVFGLHNLQNLNGAKAICSQLGVTDDQFYTAISEFKGASRRLQLLKSTPDTSIFHDFAHSPSKLRATVEAVKEQFGQRKLVACIELHTFSSLKHDFLKEYQGTMAKADLAFVYYNPKTVEHKKLAPITAQDIIVGFGRDDLNVFTDSQLLFDELMKLNWSDSNLLLMSSGNFNGVNLKQFAENLLKIKTAILYSPVRGDSSQ